MTSKQIQFTAPDRYEWSYILGVIMEHKRELVFANIIALLAALATVPIPLLMPLLVDEVLLKQPATLVGITQSLFPQSLHGPVLYILFILFCTITLRITSLLLTV